MGSVGDSLGYLIYGNPVSQALISTSYGMVKGTINMLPKILPAQAAIAPPAKPIILPLWEQAGTSYSFIRLAGLCGATAVIMGAYGKHHQGKIVDLDDKSEAKAVFETANRFHFLHSFALLAMPLVHRPLLTGILMFTGTGLFSGTLYYRAVTGDRKYIPMATCGGFCLIIAWLSLIF